MESSGRESILGEGNMKRYLVLLAVSASSSLMYVNTPMGRTARPRSRPESRRHSRPIVKAGIHIRYGS